VGVGKRLHLHDGDNRVLGALGGCPSLLSMGASDGSVIPPNVCVLILSHHVLCGRISCL
jgi:hypothetical protein